MSSTLPLFLALCLILVALAKLNYEIHNQISRFSLATTGGSGALAYIYYILMLPGLVMHEFAHWLVATFLFLRPKGIQLGPQLVKGGVKYGSVSMSTKSVYRTSLAAAAPLFAGLMALYYMGHQLQTGQAFTAGTAYMTFTFANGMIPSIVDRPMVLPILKPLAWLAAFYLLLGLPLSLITNFFDALVAPLSLVLMLLMLAIVIDLILWLGFSVLAGFFQGAR